MDIQLTKIDFRIRILTRHTAACSIVLTMLLTGCTDDADKQSGPAAPPVMRAAPSDEPEFISASDLRRKLRANEKAKFPRVGNDIVGAELFQSGVKSIEALHGLPLRAIDLGMTEVTDLAPLEGMPLERVILENTPVADISALKGMQLEVLYLQNTKVTDLSILKGMPLRGTKPAERWGGRPDDNRRTATADALDSTHSGDGYLAIERQVSGESGY